MGKTVSENIVHDLRMGSPDRGAGTIERPGQDCVCIVLPTLIGYSEFCTWIESKQTQRWKVSLSSFLLEMYLWESTLKKKKSPVTFSVSDPVC